MRILFLLLLTATATAQPNVLLILADDLGYHDLSHTGSEIYQTPNLDRLAAQSVEFTNAYANYPRCVPSRYALMTGQYPVLNGGVPDDGFKLDAIPKNQNFVQKFNLAGYRTAFFGKWHLGNSPTELGFQTAVLAGKAGSPISFHYPFNEPKGNNRKVRKAPITDADRYSRPGDYLTDVLTREVVQHLDSVKMSPFFTVLSYYAVHQPLEAKEADIEANRQEIRAHDYGDRPEYEPEGTGRTKLRQDHPTYAAMVENLDRRVGEVLDYLETSGLADNTIVVFTSDHGGLSNDGTRKRQLATSNYPLRAGKGWVYEGGVRVPLFVRMPGLSPHTDTSSIVMLMDLLPTLTDLALNQRTTGTDGQSFVPVLKNRRSWDKRSVYWFTSVARPVNTGESVYAAVRSGRWKYVDFYEAGRRELYDLTRDPRERVDLVAVKTGRARRLGRKLRRWRRRVGVE